MRTLEWSKTVDIRYERNEKNWNHIFSADLVVNDCFYLREKKSSKLWSVQINLETPQWEGEIVRERIASTTLAKKK